MSNDSYKELLRKLLRCFYADWYFGTKCYLGEVSESCYDFLRHYNPEDQKTLIRNAHWKYKYSRIDFGQTNHFSDSEKLYILIEYIDEFILSPLREMVYTSSSQIMKTGTLSSLNISALNNISDDVFSSATLSAKEKNDFFKLLGICNLLEDIVSKKLLASGISYKKRIVSPFSKRKVIASKEAIEVVNNLKPILFNVRFSKGNIHGIRDADLISSRNILESIVASREIQGNVCYLEPFYYGICSELGNLVSS